MESNPSVQIIPANEAGYMRLQAAKERLAELFQQGDYILLQAAEVAEYIGREQLYRYDTNPQTGKPYSSMVEYYPDLLAELKTSGHLAKLSERRVREWVRLNRVFVQNLQLPKETVVALNSHLSEVAEALDYDPRTGEVAENPRPGKIGRARAMEIVQELVQAKEDGVDWRVQDTRALLDTDRGISRRYVKFDWQLISPGCYWLKEITLVDDTREASFEVWKDYLPEELARWLTKKMGALSNLPEEEGA